MLASHQHHPVLPERRTQRNATALIFPIFIDLICSSSRSPAAYLNTMDLHHVEDVRARGHNQQQLVLRERGRRIKAAAELGLARSSASRNIGRRALVVEPREEEEETSTTGKRQQAPKKEATTPLPARGDHEDEGDDEEEDELLVEEKVALLRRLVPGGEDMAVEGLLEETADYIAALKAQVGAMRALTCLLLSGSDLDDALRQPELSADGVLTPEKPM